MKKVILNLPDHDVETVRNLADKRIITMTQVIRQAIATEKYIHDILRSGGKILVSKHGKVNEITFER